MTPFYTSVDLHKNLILITEITETGERTYKQVKFKPSIYIEGTPDDSACVYKSIHGQPMKKKTLADIYKYRELLDTIEESKLGKSVGGNISPVFQYISEKYKEIDADYSKIRVCYLDIETGPNSQGEFADPKFADGEILSIALKFNDFDKFIVFGCKEFADTDNIIHIKCNNERHLIKSFLKVWRDKFPDVITGWFISTFDMPYLFARICLLFGEEEAKKLSPFNVAYLRKDLDPINKNIHEDREVLYIAGIQELDYVRLYRKFATQQKEVESNALNYIAEKELNEKKVEYEGSLIQLYNDDYNKFIEYNAHDVRLVEKLDKKLDLLHLVYSLAYYSKVNFRDVFFQVRLWDSIVYNFLLKKNVVIPYNSYNNNSFEGGYVGAYVKDPQIGMKDWIVSFDVTSLYPHLILQFNVSPDTFVPDKTSSMRHDISIDNILNKALPENILEDLIKDDCCMAANRAVFTNRKVGFLPELIEEMFRERKEYKSLSIEYKKKYEQTKDESFAKKAKIYDIFQYTKKICLNSAYGALGNRYFRFYNVWLAEAITLSGQLVIRWIERACNEFLNKLFNTTNKDYCVASDTDSVYLDLSLLKGKVTTSDEIDLLIKKDLLKCVENSLEELRKLLNCKKNRIELKREIIADRGIFIAKKRYCLNVLDNEGVKYTTPQLKLMGVEAIKSSTPKVVRNLLKEAIRIILQEDQSALQKYFQKVLVDYKNCSIDDISFPRSINGLDKYTFSSKSIPIHVYGALKYNYLIKERNLKILEEIKNGDKIRFVYLKEPNWLLSHVFSYPANRSLPKELSDIKDIIDYPKMLEKSFEEPLNIILEKINWSLYKKETLLDLFE